MTGTEFAGIVHDMPEDEYHANPALGSTSIKYLLKSPAKYRQYISEPEKPKAEYDLGSLVHSRVLGVGAQVAVYPEAFLASNGAASTAAAKAWAAEQRESGLIPMKADAAADVHNMAEAVLAHRGARQILETAPGREVSAFATDPATNVDVKARFDIYGDQECADLKSCTDASRDGFTRAVWKFRYDVQQEHYLKVLELLGLGRPRFRFIAVENTAPFLVAVYELDEQWQEIGDVWATAARRIYRECTDAGIWPGYGTETHTLRPPVGLIYEHQDRFETQEMVVA
jgi:hypothetical protein